MDRVHLGGLVTPQQFGGDDQRFLSDFIENAAHRPVYRTPKPTYNQRPPEMLELQVEESKRLMHTYLEHIDGGEVWYW